MHQIQAPVCSQVTNSVPRYNLGTTSVCRHFSRLAVQTAAATQPLTVVQYGLKSPPLHPCKAGEVGCRPTECDTYSDMYSDCLCTLGKEQSCFC